MNDCLLRSFACDHLLLTDLLLCRFFQLIAQAAPFRDYFLAVEGMEDPSFGADERKNASAEAFTGTIVRQTTEMCFEQMSQQQVRCISD